MSESKRLETLEQLVRALAQELRVLRADVDAMRAAPGEGARPGAGAARSADLPPARPPAPGATAPTAATRAASPAPPRPPAAAARGAPSYTATTAFGRGPASELSRNAADLETLVGRYGAVGIAALTILMGVGAFVRWAIEHVRLGPEMRVLAGALAAVAVGLVGAWLRRRGQRGYGAVLLALALAITHVVAWGAGPQLHVVPPPLALGVAALASAALAVLAWRAVEETLFVVGVGGAFLAPFVTSDGGGSALTLLAFGWLVFTGGAAGLRERAWRAATVTLAVAVSVYAGAGLALTGGAAQPPAALVLAFALACAWSAMLLDRDGTLGGVMRATFAAAVAVALAAALAAGQRAADDGEIALRLLIVAGTLTVYAQRLRVRHADAGLLVEAGLAPLGFLLAMLVSFRDATALPAALAAAGWMLPAAAAAAHAGRARREPHLLVAGIAGGVALMLGLPRDVVVWAPALAAYGVVLVALARALSAPLLRLLAMASLGIATFSVAEALGGRPAFQYAPFGTPASLAAALTLLLWIAAGAATHDLSPAERGGADDPIEPAAAALASRRTWWIAAAVLAFLWGQQEMAFAYSPDAAGFLLIAYYAITGVATIAIGRIRDSAALRRIGLGLAVLADLRAIFKAVEIGNVGLRVGAYLLSGFFLLAVSYWAWKVRRDDGEALPAAAPPDAAVPPPREPAPPARYS